MRWFLSNFVSRFIITLCLASETENITGNLYWTTYNVWKTCNKTTIITGENNRKNTRLSLSHSLPLYPKTHYHHFYFQNQKLDDFCSRQFSLPRFVYGSVVSLKSTCQHIHTLLGFFSVFSRLVFQKIFFFEIIIKVLVVFSPQLIQCVLKSKIDRKNKSIFSLKLSFFVRLFT